MSKPLCGVLRAVKTPCSWAGYSPRVSSAIPAAKLISVPLPVQAQQRCAVLLLDQQLALRRGGHQPLGGHQEEAVSVFPAVPVGLCTSQYNSNRTGIVKPVRVLQPRQRCLNWKPEQFWGETQRVNVLKRCPVQTEVCTGAMFSFIHWKYLLISFHY